MIAEICKKMEETLPLLLPYFSGDNTLEEDTQIIGRFVAAMLPIRMCALVSLNHKAASVWSPQPEQIPPQLAAQLTARAQSLTDALVRCGGSLGDRELTLLPGLQAGKPAKLFLIRYDGQPCGLLFLQRGEGVWTQADEDALKPLQTMMGMAFAVRRSNENELLNSFMFNTLLDSMKASIYVTDPETDRILFMNQTMKDIFGLENPEGMLCWQVLQSGMHERCAFCPVPKLVKSPERVVQWDECNTVTGRSYQNYDNLIRWVDGRTVHLQQSIDVTELKSANIDELTRLLARRPGKDALHKSLELAARTAQTLTVCLYDINLLKQVNDQYGHAEGDRMIARIADAVRATLTDGDYAFRLSGDEFVVVFSAPLKTAQKRMERAARALESLRCAYEHSFCYGLAEITPQYPMTVDEALLLADERMYSQKRRYHILRNEQTTAPTVVAGLAPFSYDKQMLYNALMHSTDDYLFICNMKQNMFCFTTAMVAEFDLPGEILENAASVWASRVHPEDRQAFWEAFQGIADGRDVTHCVEYRVKNRQGLWIWVRCRGHLEFDENGAPALFAGFIHNLGLRNRIDSLTGLHNRLEFEEQANSLLEKAEEYPFALLTLGLDDLRHANDLYDRAFGDEVLRAAAQRLRTLLPVGASLFRLDGDEFAILLPGAGSTQIHKLYHSVQNSFGQQDYGDRSFYCTVSGGGVCCPDDARTYQELIKHASYTLEHAKLLGKNRCTYFSRDILEQRSHTLSMMEALRESVEGGFTGFSLHFQPLVDALGGSITGVEALARWQHPKFGAVSPVEFIPLLEQTGMIIPLGKWVLETAVQIAQPWFARQTDFILNVNLSYLQMQDETFVPFVREILTRGQLRPRNLVLELTEGHFLHEDAQVQAMFEAFRQLGVRIAIDDFGTGYSSLGILKRTAADIVKIDRSFIRDILTSHFDATFIRFVVALCHDVGIQVCLEGVETQEEYQTVCPMGLDMIQGFLFDRPMPPEALTEKYFT